MSDLKRQSVSLLTSPPDTMFLPQAQAPCLGGHGGNGMSFWLPLKRTNKKYGKEEQDSEFVLFYHTEWTPYFNTHLLGVHLLAFSPNKN